MPTFGRLGKHSNRSQHALAEQLAAGGAPSSSSLAAESATNSSSSAPLSASSSVQNQNTNAVFSSSESFKSRTAQGQHQLLHHQQLPPPPAPSSQQQPQQASHSPSAPPPPQMYRTPTGTNTPLPPLPSLQDNGAHAAGTGSSILTNRQKQSDIVDSGRNQSLNQSHRFSAVDPHTQPSQFYELSTSSVDDLAKYGPPPSIQNHQHLPHPSQQLQQQQTAPVHERRSTRKLIKGIFSGSSSRGTSDLSNQQSNNQSHDNSSGLSRKSSKRVSKNPPPALATSFSQGAPTQDWQQQQSQQSQQQQYHLPSSPLQGVGEVEEYYNVHGPNPQTLSRGSRNSLNNTIRQVSSEFETSPYEETAYRPHQQQAPPIQQQQQQQQPLQLHIQNQLSQQVPAVTRYDNTSTYDSPSPQSSLHLSQQLGFANSPQYQPSGDSRILPGHLGVSTQQPNPETVSQLSHESQITDSDQLPNNLHSVQNSPAVNPAVYHQSQGSTTSLPPIQLTSPPQLQPQQQQQSGMAPPPAGGPPPARRTTQETDKALRTQAEPPAGPPPGFRHSGSSMSNMNNNMSPLPPSQQQQQAATGQSSTYRSDRNTPFDAQAGEQGRNSPQPSTNDPVSDDKQFKDLLAKYKNVKRLYFDGKSQIDQLAGQVEQLQNAVANQRMSQSRTALDDNDYSTRFNRLNGAINNLAFNIRKDWRSIPPWLEKFVSADALKTGKQEMTAVGRAVISRWLVEEIFNKCFHPGLDSGLSQQLKDIEMNIRSSSYKLNSQEEFDALTTKVVNWRMATLEGLHRKLSSPEAAENSEVYTKKATTNLTACLYQNLSTPPPPGVEGSTSMIVELAVAIATNMPLESRDVVITYPLPGDMVRVDLMEVEKTPLPPLDGEVIPDEKGDKDKNSKGGADKAKTGMLTTPAGGGPSAGRKGSDASLIGITNTDTELGVAMPSEPSRVRFAGFVALEVRGRQVLMKAPVWAMNRPVP